MIQTTAAALAKQWARNGIIHAEDTEAYQYGLELMLSTLLNIAVMFGLSLAIGHAWLLVPYLAAFIPLRLSAGGYHAKHHVSCILFNAGIYFAGLSAVIMLPAQTAAILCIMESSLSLVMIVLFAPVPAKNKPLSARERKRNRRLSLGLGFMLLALCVLFYHSNVLAFTGCRMVFCGQAAATILLILEKASSALTKKQKKEDSCM